MASIATVEATANSFLIEPSWRTRVGADDGTTVAHSQSRGKLSRDSEAAVGGALFRDDVEQRLDGFRLPCRGVVLGFRVGRSALGLRPLEAAARELGVVGFARSRRQAE